MLPTYPSTYQWRLFALYQQHTLSIHPALFLQDWAVSYSELAQLTGVSRSTVEHWFCMSASRREPSILHRRQLAIIHYLWCNADRIPPEMIELWQDSTN